jgi:hypothetical protein
MIELLVLVVALPAGFVLLLYILAPSASGARRSPRSSRSGDDDAGLPSYWNYDSSNTMQAPAAQSSDCGSSAADTGSGSDGGSCTDGGAGAGTDSSW